MLLQISFFVHNIDSLAGWMAQSELLVDSEEHKEVFEVLRRETSSLRLLLFKGRVKTKMDPKTVLVSIRDSLMKANGVISKLMTLVGSTSSTADPSALRQCIFALREAVTAAEDVFDGSSTATKHSSSNDALLLFEESSNDNEQQVGDIILSADIVLWRYLSSDSSAVSRLTFSAQSSTEVAQIPAWRARCVAIQNKLADWEKAQSQIQVILFQKKAVESELENRRDELSAALRRCEELAVLAAKSESTGRGSRRGAQSKLDEEIKVYLLFIYII
jgi:hypothetical protein